MAGDIADVSTQSVRLVRIEHEHGVAALQAADVIAMTFAASDGGEHLVFAMRLPRSECGLCAFGAVPGDVLVEAKAVAERWRLGETLPHAITVAGALP